MKKYLLLLLFSLLGCNQSSTSTSSLKAPISQTSNSNTLVEKLKSKPKIFLKFWSGMSYEEYFAVCNILDKEGITQNGYYQNSKIDCTLQNDIITAIVLKNVNSELYQLYKKKYNLPPLIEKTTITENYVENNPEYNPTMTYTNGSKTTVLPNCFRDKAQEIPDNSRVNLVPTDEDITKFMIDNEYTIDKKDFVIIINQEIVSDPLNTYRYSLSDNKDIERYLSSDQGKETFGNNFMGGLNADCINTNSKLRYVTKNHYPYITITYMSKKEYLSFLKKRKINELSENDEELKTKVEQKRVLNEI